MNRLSLLTMPDYGITRGAVGLLMLLDAPLWALVLAGAAVLIAGAIDLSPAGQSRLRAHATGGWRWPCVVLDAFQVVALIGHGVWPVGALVCIGGLLRHFGARAAEGAQP